MVQEIRYVRLVALSVENLKFYNKNLSLNLPVKNLCEAFIA